MSETRRQERTLTEEPRLIQSSTERDELARTKLRTERADPSVVPQMTDNLSADPTCKRPETETLEPALTKERTEVELPKWA